MSTLDRKMEHTKKAVSIINDHRGKLRKRSDIAREVAKLRDKRKQIKDRNAITSLISVFKKAKKKALDIRRLDVTSRKETASSSSGAHKIILVLRNRRRAESSESISILQSMGLYKPGSGRMLSNSTANMKKIGLVMPFVCYGTPTEMNIKRLLHKRGTLVMPTGEEKLITSNMAVEEMFPNSSIVCIADVAACIYNRGDLTDDILSKLGTLNIPDIDMEEPLKWGDIGASINDRLEWLL